MKARHWIWISANVILWMAVAFAVGYRVGNTACGKSARYVREVGK